MSLRAFVPAVLILFAVSCASYDEVVNLDSGGRTIVFLGDSLTAGVGAKKGEEFPAVIERMMTGADPQRRCLRRYDA